MIEYHIFWILYALFTLGGWNAYNAHDCTVLGEVTKQESKYMGATCYVKRGDAWEIAK
jgi:hypothetical protein